MHTYNRNLNIDHLNILLNDHALENLYEGMFLGVTIDKKLNYRAHIDHISIKISKAIDILFKLNSLKVSKRVLKQV